MKKHITIISMATFILWPAFAADLAPEASAVEPPAVAPKVARPWSFSIEGSPEFFTIDQKPGTSAKREGDLVDFYGKAGVSYTFDNAIVLGGTVQLTTKKNRNDNGSEKPDTYQNQAETTLGYKYKIDDFTLTPSVGLGYIWGTTGIFGKGAVPSKDMETFYYTAALAGDLKLNKTVTWNAFNVRWRDAFDYAYQTPRVATGLTYNLDDSSAIYTNVGYAWKKVNSGKDPNFTDIDADKWNVTLGLKKSF